VKRRNFQQNSLFIENMTTLHILVFLLLLLATSSSYCTAQVISDLLQRFTFSHLAVPQRLAVFWRLENDSISYAIAGKFLSNNPSGIGWVATGWNPSPMSGSNMIGSTAVMGMFVNFISIRSVVER
jgi:hypothetical protein